MRQLDFMGHHYELYVEYDPFSEQSRAELTIRSGGHNGDAAVNNLFHYLTQAIDAVKPIIK